MQQPMEQRVGALGEKIRDHDQLLDSLVTISGQLTSLQDQLQGVVIHQQASPEDLQERQQDLQARQQEFQERQQELKERRERTDQQNARLMNLLMNLARRYGWDEGLDEDEDAPAFP